MILTIVKVWKTFALAKDPNDNIATAMKSVQKTSKAEANKETHTKEKKKLKKESNEPRKLKETMFLKQKAKPEPNYS